MNPMIGPGSMGKIPQITLVVFSLGTAVVEQKFAVFALLPFQRSVKFNAGIGIREMRWKLPQPI